MAPLAQAFARSTKMRDSFSRPAFRDRAKRGRGQFFYGGSKPACDDM